MDYASDDAGSSPTYYLLFSFFPYLQLLSCILSEDDNRLWGIHSSHNQKNRREEEREDPGNEAVKK